MSRTCIALNRIATMFMLSASLLVPLPAAGVSTLTVLHSFTSGADGFAPVAPVLFGPGGKLFGTTLNTVFEIDPATGILTTLHTFLDSPDGAFPDSGLVRSRKGVLYGTTLAGGANGFGTIYKINPKTQALTILHNFTGTDGSGPVTELLLGLDGLFYGTTLGGGPKGNNGTIFVFNPLTNILTTLRALQSSDGTNPSAGLVQDAQGAFYGVAGSGGKHGKGTLFKITQSGTKPVFRKLHDFTGGPDGDGPGGTLVIDSAGVLYGTTSSGGPRKDGTVFSYSPALQTIKSLHIFRGPDGINPSAGLTLGNGVLYGVTTFGGGSTSGTAFKLDIATKALTTLWNFSGGPSGGLPQARMVLKGGFLYGTTFDGGSFFSGVVFQLTP